MVIRGYLAGHAAREYKLGKRLLCGASMPEGMRENDAFPEPIITPATKAELGTHDEDITPEALVSRGIVSQQVFDLLAGYTRALFTRGTEMAAKQGLILVDTKYEFGIDASGEILLIDEIHARFFTRYFCGWLFMLNDRPRASRNDNSQGICAALAHRARFQGKSGQQLPDMSDVYIASVSRRYIELYEHITGKSFQKAIFLMSHRECNTI